jgi:hypothetical protein
MAYRYCDICGNIMSDMEGYCPNCGSPANSECRFFYPPLQQYEYRRKIPGRGFGISGMVLGILGVVYGQMPIGVISSYNAGAAVITVFPIIFGVLALIFGILAVRKGYSGGVGKSGIVLGAVTIFLCIIVILVACIQSGRSYEPYYDYSYNFMDI